MLSILLPKNIKFFNQTNLYKIQGPRGNQIKATDNTSFFIVQTGEGNRIFINTIDKTKTATSLFSRHKIVQGLSIGWQKRLRLVGVGFRAITIDTSFNNEYASSELNIKNYLRKRMLFLSTTYPQQKNQFLKLKIGFSHEVIYPMIVTENNHIKVSRIDGRTKGIVVTIKSNDKHEVNQFASEIRSFRFPGVYKTKGIYYNKETVKLKKGKRQS